MLSLLFSLAAAASLRGKKPAVLIGAYVSDSQNTVSSSRCGSSWEAAGPGTPCSTNADCQAPSTCFAPGLTGWSSTANAKDANATPKPVGMNLPIWFTGGAGLNWSALKQDSCTGSGLHRLCHAPKEQDEDHDGESSQNFINIGGGGQAGDPTGAAITPTQLTALTPGYLKQMKLYGWDGISFDVESLAPADSFGGPSGVVQAFERVLNDMKNAGLKAAITLANGGDTMQLSQTLQLTEPETARVVQGLSKLPWYMFNPQMYDASGTGYSPWGSYIAQNGFPSPCDWQKNSGTLVVPAVATADGLERFNAGIGKSCAGTSYVMYYANK
jgi:hypothetical protein